jgi:hypothetical protein
MKKSSPQRINPHEDEPDLPWFYGYLTLVGGTVLTVGLAAVVMGVVGLILFGRKATERQDPDGTVVLIILGGVAALFVLLNMTLLTAATWFLAVDIGASLQHLKLYTWRLRQAAHRMEGKDDQ